MPATWQLMEVNAGSGVRLDRAGRPRPVMAIEHNGSAPSGCDSPPPHRFYRASAYEAQSPKLSLAACRPRPKVSHAFCAMANCSASKELHLKHGGGDGPLRRRQLRERTPSISVEGDRAESRKYPLLQLRAFNGQTALIPGGFAPILKPKILFRRFYHVVLADSRPWPVCTFAVPVGPVQRRADHGHRLRPYQSGHGRGCYLRSQYRHQRGSECHHK